jgi:NTE family protein
MKRPGLTAVEQVLALLCSRATRGALCGLALVCGCAWGIADKPMGRWDPTLNARWIAQLPDDRSEELLVFLAFSGGGTRAAALSYGVLKGLAATEIEIGGKRRRLLDEVDVISSVSGGSFTAAYYGLHGERTFADYESRFLRKDVEAALIERFLWPPNLVRIMSGTYGRSDVAAAYYDEILFDGATFGDLFHPKAPLVVINATDLASGSRFGFTQLFFDLICADYDRYPISRGVAASSAVPLLLSPITLRNYTPECGYTAPPWLEAVAKDRTSPRRQAEARVLLSYLDVEHRKYVHLVDGGIADNLGLRAAFQFVGAEQSSRAAFEQIGHPHPRLILMILVNAQSHHEPTFAESAASPALTELIDTVTSDQISLYNFETIELVSTALESWATELSTPKRPVSAEFVDVSFDAVQDEADREALNAIGTNFSLTDEEVDRLIGAGQSLLRASPQFQESLKVLRPDVSSGRKVK